MSDKSKTVAAALAALVALIAFEWAAFAGIASFSEQGGVFFYVQVPSVAAGGFIGWTFANHAFVSACVRCTKVLGGTSVFLAIFYAAASHPI